MEETDLGLRIGLALAIVLTIISAAVPIYVVATVHFSDRQDLRSLGNDRLVPGGRGSVRVVMPGKDPHRFERASVTVDLNGPRRRQRLASGGTDQAGLLTAGFLIPKSAVQDSNLVVTASSHIGDGAPVLPMALLVRGPDIDVAAERLRGQQIDRISRAFFARCTCPIWPLLFICMLTCIAMAAVAYQRETPRTLWFSVATLACLAILVTTALGGTYGSSMLNTAANWSAQGMVLPLWVTAGVYYRKEWE
jgi:hypothetical protein